MILKLKSILIHVILPILFGFTIYILLRPSTTYSFNNFFGAILKEIDLQNYFQFTHPNWLNYNLPDAFWGYAFLSSIIIIWNKNEVKEIVFWILCAFAIGVSIELLQFFSIVSGTFDVYDILFIVLGMSFSVFLNYVNKKEELT